MASPVDRLADTARAIRDTSMRTAPAVIRPYPCSVVFTPLGDLVREVDSAELCLFSTTPKLARAQFVPATPLRKLRLRGEDSSKSSDSDPESYAQAAIKCLDRYSAIRPIRGAHTQVSEIIDRLKIVRQTLQNLNINFHQAQSSHSQSIKVLIESEERAIKNLRIKLSQLDRRKLDVLNKRKWPEELPPPHNACSVAPPVTQKETTFWKGPATVRTLHFTDNLTENQHSDVNSLENLSPRCANPSDPSVDECPTSVEMQDIPAFEPQPLDKEGDGGNRFDGGTVSVGSIPKWTESPRPDLSLDPVQQKKVSCEVDIQNMINDSKQIIDVEVEMFVARIWATVGDTIMPGHSYDIHGSGVGRKPPQAKETISFLRALSSPSPSPSTVHPSLTEVPSSQQSLTAHLLLCLLQSSPRFAIPFNEVKNLLTLKAGEVSDGKGVVDAGQNTTRILYGCVAKRLIKIERGKGEQIVKFDV